MVIKGISFFDKHINYIFQNDVFFDRFSFNDTAKLNVVKILVDIDNTKKSDDELDAIAIALTASAHLKS